MNSILQPPFSFSLPFSWSPPSTGQRHSYLFLSIYVYQCALLHAHVHSCTFRPFARTSTEWSEPRCWFLSSPQPSLSSFPPGYRTVSECSPLHHWLLHRCSQPAYSFSHQIPSPPNVHRNARSSCWRRALRHFFFFSLPSQRPRITHHSLRIRVPLLAGYSPHITHALGDAFCCHKHPHRSSHPITRPPHWASGTFRRTRAHAPFFPVPQARRGTRPFFSLLSVQLHNQKHTHARTHNRATTNRQHMRQQQLLTARNGHGGGRTYAFVEMHAFFCSVFHFFCFCAAAKPLHMWSALSDDQPLVPLDLSGFFFWPCASCSSKNASLLSLHCAVLLPRSPLFLSFPHPPSTSRPQPHLTTITASGSLTTSPPPNGLDVLFRSHRLKRLETQRRG